jgi:hypothetical protein
MRVSSGSQGRFFIGLIPRRSWLPMELRNRLEKQNDKTKEVEEAAK